MQRPNDNGIITPQLRRAILEEEIKHIKSLTAEQEKMAKFFIYAVWRLMPKGDRFSPYQFSLWMDNESHLQSMKERLVKKIFPNDNDGYEKFFDCIKRHISPILENDLLLYDIIEICQAFEY